MGRVKVCYPCGEQSEEDDIYRQKGGCVMKKGLFCYLALPILIAFGLTAIFPGGMVAEGKQFGCYVRIKV